MKMRDNAGADQLTLQGAIQRYTILRLEQFTFDKTNSIFQ